jgi:hypothetical protein
MFPQMRFLTENSLNAASAIATGETPESEGFLMMGRGAFTKAYSNEQYVVKGDDLFNNNRENSAAWNYRKWFKNSFRARATSKLFNKACKKYLAPTVVLFETVVVQERVKWMGNKFSFALCYAVEDLAILLGVTDMHGANWGVTAAGGVKLFDIMPHPRFPKGKAFTENDKLQKTMDEVERLLQQELPAIMKKG